MPIAILGPGPEPRERDGITQVESGHDILLPDADTWNRIDKAVVPIVIGWNGHYHYVLTIHLSAPEVEQWNLDCITIYSMNSLDIIPGMQWEHLSEVAKNKLDELEVTLRSTVQLFSGTPVAPVAAAITATRHKKNEVPTSIITSHLGTIGFGTTSTAASASANPVCTPSPAARPPPARSPTPSSESSVSSKPVVRRKKHIKKHQCSTCGKTFEGKSDYDSHQEVVHGQGYYCGEHSKYFKHKKGYKQHLKNIHEGKYNYNCSLCEFKTDGKQLYAQHMVKSHNKKVPENEKKRLVCPKCWKKFPGHQLMKVHLKKTECSTKFKSFQCGGCKKWLKTRASLEQHRKVYHTLGSRRYKCSRCNAEFGSFSALYNYHIHHRGLDALKRLGRTELMLWLHHPGPRVLLQVLQQPLHHRE